MHRKGIKKTKTPDPLQNFLEFLIHQNTDTQFLVNDIELLASEKEIIDLRKEHKNGVIATEDNKTESDHLDGYSQSTAKQ